MTTSSFDESVVHRAREYGTATMHEAADRRGAMPSRIRPITTGLSVAGRVFTVECAPLDNLWLHRALIKAEPGDVLVATVSDAREAGYWGEVLSRAAVARGLGGLVIDGGVRDSAVLTEVGFPVFAERVCIRGTTKDGADGTGGLRGPLAFDDLVVRTGDLVVADADGVAVFAADRVPALLDASRERVAKEQRFFAELQRGATTLELMGLQ